MANPIKFRVDQREFQATLRKYTQFSKRDIPTICNTKAFYIARRATVETPKASKVAINKFIKAKDGELIGKLINKRRGARGEKGLYGADMAKAVLVVKAARARSIAFLKSGWLWAVKALEPFAERPGAVRQDRTAKAIGKAKGAGFPARQGWSVTSKILNTVTAKWDKNQTAATKAEPALQRAFNAENQSMMDYIERKLRGTAKKSSIKTN